MIKVNRPKQIFPYLNFFDEICLGLPKIMGSWAMSGYIVENLN